MYGMHHSVSPGVVFSDEFLANLLSNRGVSDYNCLIVLPVKILSRAGEMGEENLTNE